MYCSAISAGYTLYLWHRAADAIRSDGERKPIGQRTQSDWTADGNQRRCAAHRCTNKANRESVPQNTRNTQNLLAGICLPQIGTDVHRLGGYGIPAIPTPPITQPNHLWKSVKSVGEYYHAGAAASAAPTKQTERVFHRIRGTHRTFWQRKPPTDRHRCTQIRRVWHPCHTHAANNAT